MTNRTAYIAGPMRGKKDFNFPAFDALAADARAVGYKIFNPAEHDRECGFDETKGVLDGFDLQAAMRWDIQAILDSDEILLLPDWEKSTGVAIELTVARAVGCPVYETRYEPRLGCHVGRRFDLDAHFAEPAPQSITALQTQAFDGATARGFHDNDDEITIAHRLLLIIGEVNEAFEELRSGHDVTEVYEKDGKPEGVPVELADVVIRIMDFCGSYGIDLQQQIIDKLAFNETRAYKHGRSF